MRVPSGLNATQMTPPLCPLSVWISWPVTESNTLTNLSSLAVAIREPSGLNATSKNLVGPLIVRVSWPLAASQTRTV